MVWDSSSPSSATFRVNEMKLREILLDWIGQTDLFEMAKARKEARRFIALQASPIVEQFLKLTYLNSPNDYPHWIHDGIDNYLHQIQDIILKEDNSRPDPATYYVWLFDDLFTLNESNIIGKFVRVRRKYANVLLKKEFNPTEALSDIQHLFNPGTSKLLYDISTDKFHTILDYYKF